MPTGEVRATEITNFPRTNEIVERAQRLFDGCDGIETVQLKEVNVIGAKTFQGTFHGTDQMKARGPDIIRPVTETKCRFGGNEHFITTTGDGFSKDFLRHSS